VRRVQHSSSMKRMIPVSKLDDILGDRFASDRLFIKVDVEGAEYDVVYGSSRLIERTPPVAWMVEIYLSELHPGGINPNFTQTFEALWKYGYRSFTTNKAPREITLPVITEWIRRGRTDNPSGNYLFVKCL